MMMEAILKATLEVPFWCSFRVPTAVNFHPTYPVPPMTTLYGLIAAAMGWPSDDYSQLENLEISVVLVESGERIEGYNKIIKWDRRDREMRTLIMRHKLIQPVYQLLAKGSEKLITEIKAALEDPYFPLCLGESDDLVEVKDIGIYPVVMEETKEINSLLPQDKGRPSNQVQLLHLPVNFLGGMKGKTRVWSGLEYRGYYVAEKIELNEPIPAYALGEQKVVF